MIACLWFAAAGLLAGILVGVTSRSPCGWDEADAMLDRGEACRPDGGHADHVYLTKPEMAGLLEHEVELDALRASLGMPRSATVPEMADRIRAIRHAREAMAGSVSPN